MKSRFLCRNTGHILLLFKESLVCLRLLEMSSVSSGPGQVPSYADLEVFWYFSEILFRFETFAFSSLYLQRNL